MKPFFIGIAIILLNGIASFSQKKNHITPPGTVKVNDTLYVDRNEVSNIGWREYLYYLSEFDSLSLPGVLPDTTVWLDEQDNSGETFSEYYFRHPGFNTYPVVGISYNQANIFCRWRTIAANFAVYIKKNKITDWRNHIRDSFPIQFYYRLPSKEEWELFAFPGVDSSSKAFKKSGRKATFFFNTKEYFKFVNTDESGAHHYRGTSYTVAAHSFFPGRFGTYHLTGNVAEMLSEKGIAKGGSFDHPLSECHYKNNQYYTGPERWLGFRCVAVLIK